MLHTTFLIKPASGFCNMRCKYCFYENVSDTRTVKNRGFLTKSLSAEIIQKAFASTDSKGSVCFMFQGGEPTLAGLDFFRDFIALVKKYALPDIQVNYAIQTNGICLNQEWVQFFYENKFLVGLSLDAFPEVHNHLRIDTSGRGTWNRVTKALKLLELFRVETNLLCVVTRQIAQNAQRTYDSLSQSGHALQFIPCLDPLETQRGSMPYSLTPDLYGQFLCHLFDNWYQAWQKGYYTSIRLFDDYLRILAGMSPSSCAVSGSCGHYLVVEGDGSLYPCDFYVLDSWYLGNICDVSVEDALTSGTGQSFWSESNHRPEECQYCPYYFLCRGGCKRDWCEQHHNYYCQSYQVFFAHALARLIEIAQ